MVAEQDLVAEDLPHPRVGEALTVGTPEYEEHGAHIEFVNEI